MDIIKRNMNVTMKELNHSNLPPTLNSLDIYIVFLPLGGIAACSFPLI